MATNQRFDLMPIGAQAKAPRDEYMETSLTKTDEGFLTGRAICTNIGVFSYRQQDGKMRRELRLPSEVRDSASLASLKMKPITNDHPTGTLVNPENVSKLAVGTTGDDIRCDSYHVSVPITVTEKDAIKAVEGGKHALSCGYTCDLDPTPGVWMGVEYDAVQKNIRYNHVALVDKARAGDAAKLRMDGADISVYIEGEGDEEELEDENEDGCGKAKNGDSHETIVVDSGVVISTVALGLRQDFNPNHSSSTGQFVSTAGGGSKYVGNSGKAPGDMSRKLGPYLGKKPSVSGKNPVELQNEIQDYLGGSRAGGHVAVYRNPGLASQRALTSRASSVYKHKDTPYIAVVTNRFGSAMRDAGFDQISITEYAKW